ncbi:hypothetical protein T492DRAFT_438120 [Pavlovales sp. CCMP2436]|nr:hypothetical protein T492DRAFT_438120 [Pavlovales sp. CCMP2436]
MSADTHAAWLEIVGMAMLLALAARIHTSFSIGASRLPAVTSVTVGAALLATALPEHALAQLWAGRLLAAALRASGVSLAFAIACWYLFTYGSLLERRPIWAAGDPPSPSRAYASVLVACSFTIGALQWALLGRRVNARGLGGAGDEPLRVFEYGYFRS